MSVEGKKEIWGKLFLLLLLFESQQTPPMVNCKLASHLRAVAPPLSPETLLISPAKFEEGLLFLPIGKDEVEPSLPRPLTRGGPP